MRELKSSDRNVLTLNDAMGGGKVVFYYRTPTTVERINFTKSQTKRQGNKIISRIAEARLNSGFAILTGIRTGDFAFDGAVISSTPGEEGYRADWKELVYHSASDLLMILGQQIFEGEQILPNSIEFEDDSPEEPVIALAGSGPAITGPAGIADADELLDKLELPIPLAPGEETALLEEKGEAVPLASSQTSGS
ncbi:MAG TPA: hypothetical protein DCP69_08045 [Candidatus Omnitrophica bacterium]|nr:hypothetical protein [Candidatus Omnitrophota bacterium]